jgi:phosphoglycolate phosphatase
MSADEAPPGPPLAIVLDLDGTLVDSLADIADAMNATLRAAGMPTHEPRTYRTFVGHGLAALVRQAMAPGGDHAALLAAARARYQEHCVDRTRPYPGVLQMLVELRDRGIALAVLSNKPQPMTDRVVRELLGEIPFGAIVGDRPDVPRKPDPAGALAIAKALDAPPSRCWLVGDSAVDVQTAKAAGMRGIAVTWGFRPVQELRAARPDAFIDSPGALVRLVDGHGRVSSGP